jgi:hypothetical protein
MGSSKYFFIIASLLLASILPAQVAVSLDKMNVLYPSGVENLVTVAATDIPDSNLMLIPSMGEIRRTKPGHYIWTICHRDTNFATLTIRDLVGDTLVKVFTFRVNRIPVPVPLLGAKHKSSEMPNGEYVRSNGLAVLLNSFDFDLRCDVIYFDFDYFARNSDILSQRNEGPRYNSQISIWVSRAKPGDKYYFYNIAYRCGCDPMIRHLSEELNFTIE